MRLVGGTLVKKGSPRVSLTLTREYEVVHYDENVFGSGL